MLNPKFIFTHETPYIGGITIHGAIGTRDYNMNYEDARKCYLQEAKHLQAKLGFSDEQMLNETVHRLGATYRGNDTLEQLLFRHARNGIYHPAMDLFGIAPVEEKPVNECYD